MGASQTTNRGLNRSAFSPDDPSFVKDLDIDRLVTNFASRPFDVNTGSLHLIQDVWHMVQEHTEQKKKDRETSMNRQITDMKKRNPSKLTKETVIETPHNYLDNTDIIYTAHLPGATQLVLEFDPQCKTEANYDYLQMYLGPEKSIEFQQKWSGTDWPTTPIVVDQDIVYFHFFSDGSNNEWGFKCVVTGVFEQDEEGDLEESSVNVDEVNVEDLTIRTFIKTVTLLLTSLSKIDKELRDGVLNTFGTLLQQTKPGSMAGISPLLDSSVSEFGDYLNSLLSGDDLSPEQESRIIVLLVALSIARGSQQNLLKLIPQIIDGSGAVPILPYLRNWLGKKEPVDANLSTCQKNDGYCMKINVAWPDSNRTVYSFCSDGTYLYLAGTFGIFKVGTGRNLTDNGKIYATSNISDDITKLHINYVNGTLYLNGTWDDNITLALYDTKYLKLIEKYTDDVFADKFISDSVNLYRVVQETEENDDPDTPAVVTNFVNIYNVEEEEWWNNPDIHEITLEQNVKVTEAWTNGSQLSILNINDTKADFHKYDLSDFSVNTVSLEIAEQCDDTVKHKKRVFDVNNNVTWVMDESANASFYALPNPGFYRPNRATFISEVQNSILEKVINSGDEIDIEQAEACQAIFAIMDEYITPYCKVRFPSGTDPKEFKRKKPFIYDLDKDCFQTLFDLLNLCFVSTDSNSQQAYQLLVVLRVCRANFQQILTYNKSAKPFGLSSELAEQYVELFYRLIDLEDFEDESLCDAAKEIRYESIQILASYGFKYIYPTKQAQLEMFADLLKNKDNLSKGKSNLLELLLTQTGDKLLSSFLNANYIDTAKNILFGILDELGREAFSICEKLPSPVTDLNEENINEFRPADTPNPLLVFLKSAQDKLRGTEEKQFDQLKIDYLEKLLEMTGSVLQKLGEKPERFDDATRWQLDSYGALVSDSFERAFGLLPSALLDVPELITKTDFARTWYDELMECCIQVENLLILYPQSASSSCVEKIVETAHPYPDNNDETWEFTFDGCNVLSFVFDEQSRTERNYDYITITDGAGIDHQYSGTAFGTAEGFPKEVELPGPTCTVKFHSDGSNNDWGVKLYISGVAQTMSWFVEMQRLLSWLAVRANCALVDAVESEDYLEHRKWLDSFLFANGTRVDEFQEDEEIITMIINDSGNGSNLFNRCLEFDDTSEEFVNAVNGDEKLDHLAKQLLAALIYHRRGGRAAARFASSKPGTSPPFAVATPWESTVTIVNWVKQKKDTIMQQKPTVEVAEGEEQPTEFTEEQLAEQLIKNEQECEEFVDKTIEKCGFLLSLTPATKPTPKKSLAARKLLMLSEKREPTEEDKRNEAIRRWKMAIQASRALTRWTFWKKAMRSGLSNTQKEDSAAKSSQEVVKFIQDDITLEPFTTIIEENSSNASLRIMGLSAIRNMLSSPLTQFTQSELLSDLTSALCGGPMYRTQGASSSDLLKVKEEFWLLAGVLTEKIPDSSPEIFLELAGFFNMRLDGDHKHHLIETGLFPILAKYLQKEKSNSIPSKVGWSLFSALMTQCLLPEKKGEERHRRMRRVNYINDTLFGFLENESSSKDDSFLFKILGLLLLMYRAIPKDYLSEVLDVTKANMLVDIIVKSDSVRCKLMILQALEFSLPGLSPDDVGFEGTGLTELLINATSISMFPKSSLFPDITKSALSSEKHQSQFATACIVLIRTLSKSEKWKDIIFESLSANIEYIGPVLEFFNNQWENVEYEVPSDEDWTSIVKVATTLSICGGHSMSLTPGCQAKGGKHEGIYLGESDGQHQMVTSDGTFVSFEESKIAVKAGASKFNARDLFDFETMETLFTLPDVYKTSSKGKLKHRVYRYLYSKIRKLGIQAVFEVLRQNENYLTQFISNSHLPVLLKDVMEFKKSKEYTPSTIKTLHEVVSVWEDRLQSKVSPLKFTLSNDGFITLDHSTTDLESHSFKAINSELLNEEISGYVCVPYHRTVYDLENISDTINGDVDYTSVDGAIAKDNIALVKLPDSNEIEFVTNAVFALTEVGVSSIAFWGNDTFDESTLYELDFQLPIIFLNSGEKLFLTVMAIDVAIELYEKGINRLDNLSVILRKYKWNEIPGDELRNLLENNEKGSDLKPVKESGSEVDETAEDDENESSYLDDEEENCGPESKLSRPDDTHDYTSSEGNDTLSAKVIELDSGLFEESRDVKFSSLTTHLAEIYSSVVWDTKRKCLIHVLGNWPKNEPLTIEKLGNATSLARFVLLYAKNQKPESYFKNSTSSHPLHNYITSVNNLLVNDDSELSSALLEKTLVFFKQDAKSQMAALVIVKHVLLLHPKIFADSLPKLHLETRIIL
eukprot:TRINITY_DN5989_c0_g1_i2.p1 TRINITY_DN5989_c0_g1~~TRINITY_DN5989_c0_g1_i2.p1  ORF type:complete len:2327 (+),score=605.23 TRINITY_DN5989_c0_g1_i2:71-7051(+)